MRLVDTNTLQLKDVLDTASGYAILSHRWEHEEVTFQDVLVNRHKTLHGWSKIEFCCRLAKSRGLQYAWIDTCCIDKTSSAELTEAINSMYAWYQEAQECYAYLVDVIAHPTSLPDVQAQIRSSVWFTRGWTLQELIAPSNVRFYNKHWDFLGTKAELCSLIQETTNISVGILCGNHELAAYSIAQRMSWAAHRQTTRVEDQAYCLLGIFDVNMPLLYGEKGKAFRRLQEEIIKQSDDQTIFAWHDERVEKPALAPAPVCFAHLHDLRCIYATNDLRSGYSLSNSGLRIDLMLIPWDMDIYVTPLSCGRLHVKSPGPPTTTSKRGYDRLGIFVRKTHYQNHFIRVSIGGEDTIMLNSDVVAYKRDRLAIRGPVFLRQTLFDLPPRPYYGFLCLFKHDGMFHVGAKPQSYEEDSFRSMRERSDLKPFALPCVPGTHRATARFRLSGFKIAKPNVLFMYLAFGLDFAPLCLITTRTSEHRSSEDPPINRQEFVDLPPLVSAVRGSDLVWVLSELERGESSETELCFRGHPSAATEVYCKRLSLKISFNPSSDETGWFAWNVHFEQLTDEDWSSSCERSVSNKDVPVESRDSRQTTARSNSTVQYQTLAPPRDKPLRNRNSLFVMSRRQRLKSVFQKNPALPQVTEEPPILIESTPTEEPEIENRVVTQRRVNMTQDGSPLPPRPMY